MGRIAGVTAAETRERLLRAAADVFAERGYDGTRVADIAAAAGVSNGALYAHFGSKADLLVAALRTHGRHLLGQLFAADPDRPVVDLLLTVGRSLPRCRDALIVEALVAARRDEDVAGPMRAFLAAIEPLGPRAHTLWIQLPPSFAPGDLGALAGFMRRLPGQYRYAVEVRHRAFFADPRWEKELEGLLDNFDAEWVPFDTTVLFGKPAATDTEREAWTKKPRVPRRTRALTGHPVVRYLGRDDPDETAAGWQPWLDVVGGWLGEGRSPTVFIHTPDNVQAPELARRFHNEVRARVPGLEPLPEPVEAGPATLF